MTYRIWRFLLPALFVAALSSGFLALGYRIDWPTLVYTLVALVVVDIIHWVMR